MRIYISGKITGIEDDARVNFEIAENIIRAMGHEPVNPFKLRHKKDATWEDYMRKDIRELTKCDAIWMLPDWKESKGAKIEMQLADNLKIHKMYQKSHPRQGSDGYHFIEMETCNLKLHQLIS
jgi:hypothetical protein